MEYVFNKKTGKGFVLITEPEELMLYVKHPQHIEDVRDLREARECQHILNGLSIDAIRSYISQMRGSDPPEEVDKDYEERAKWSEDFDLYLSGSVDANPPVCLFFHFQEP